MCVFHPRQLGQTLTQRFQGRLIDFGRGHHHDARQRVVGQLSQGFAQPGLLLELFQRLPWADVQGIGHPRHAFDLFAKGLSLLAARVEFQVQGNLRGTLP
ncbi:hypothetical protein D3C81_1740200 [compost metagenome]